MSTNNICLYAEIRKNYLRIITKYMYSFLTIPMVPSLFSFRCLTNTVLFDRGKKQAYSNILKILPPKNENFQIIISDIFHISAQNIDCGYSLELPRRGGSNEDHNFMFLSRNM